VSAADLERAIRRVLGVDETEDLELTVVEPQFEREDGITPADPSSWGTEQFARLGDLDDAGRRSLGMRPYVDMDDGKLWLFPGEWYDHIPEGFPITSITGEDRRFHPDFENRDIRYGCLAYGVIAQDGDDLSAV
jgi:hypothetical protein